MSPIKVSPKSSWDLSCAHSAPCSTVFCMTCVSAGKPIQPFLTSWELSPWQLLQHHTTLWKIDHIVLFHPKWSWLLNLQDSKMSEYGQLTKYPSLLPPCKHDSKSSWTSSWALMLVSVYDGWLHMLVSKLECPSFLIYTEDLGLPPWHSSMLQTQHQTLTIRQFCSFQFQTLNALFT